MDVEAAACGPGVDGRGEWGPGRGLGKWAGLRAGRCGGRHLCQVMGVLKRVTERTPGSFLEVKDSCLAWHYRDADPDFGMSQAKSLHQRFDEVGSNGHGTGGGNAGCR